MVRSHVGGLSTLRRDDRKPRSSSGHVRPCRTVSNGFLNLIADQVKSQLRCCRYIKHSRDIRPASIVPRDDKVCDIMFRSSLGEGILPMARKSILISSLGSLLLTVVGARAVGNPAAATIRDAAFAVNSGRQSGDRIGSRSTANDTGLGPGGRIEPDSTAVPRPSRRCRLNRPTVFRQRPMDQAWKAESLPGELTEDISQAASTLRLGPTPVSQVRILGGFLGGLLGEDNWFAEKASEPLAGSREATRCASTGSGSALRRDPPEPIRRQFPAQPDWSRTSEAAQPGPVRHRIQHPLLRRSGRGARCCQGGRRCRSQQSSFWSRLPRPVCLGTFTDDHGRGRGLQIRPNEHNHRLQRLPVPLSAVLLE